MRGLLFFAAGLCVAASVLLLRRAYISHVVSKSLRAEFDEAHKRALFNEALQQSYSDGWDAGYKKACDEAKYLADHENWRSSQSCD